MITPKFTLEQNEKELILKVEAPYTNIKDTEIHVDGDDVRFFSAPYYLRLTLPGSVQETDNSSAKYISDESMFVITLDKVNPGEYFEGLNMITTLLQPTGVNKGGSKKPLIEVMEDDSNGASAIGACGGDPPGLPPLGLEDLYYDYGVDPEDVKQEEACRLNYGYGFGDSHHGLGIRYNVELGEISEIQTPDSVDHATRSANKAIADREKFSDDQYLYDLMENSDIPQILEFQFDTESLKQLTAENLAQMKELLNLEFLLEKDEEKSIRLGLADILFAYCYDWRIGEGVHSVESVWNISRLSGVLSWFVSFYDINDLILSSLRRSLSYPLYRHWDLSMKVFQDTIQVLRTGPQAVLICLLDIIKLFNERSPYYLLNQLYIYEYAVWIQKVSPEKLNSLASAMEKVVSGLRKSDTRFDLIQLEDAARLVQEEEEEDEDEKEDEETDEEEAMENELSADVQSMAI